MNLTQSLEDLQEDLKCPVCLKIPRSIPIYQCMSGHIICKECKPRLKSCPVCRIPLENQSPRALMTERFVMKIPLKCHNADHGCQQPEMLLTELEKHERNCEFRLAQCPVNLLNYSNVICKENLPISQMTQHLKDKHPKNVLTGKNTIGVPMNLVLKARNESGQMAHASLCTIELKHQSKNYSFILLRTTGKSSEGDEFYKFYLCLIGSQKEAKQFKYNIKCSDKLRTTSYGSQGSMVAFDAKPMVPSLMLHVSQVKELLAGKEDFPVYLMIEEESRKRLMMVEQNENLTANKRLKES